MNGKKTITSSASPEAGDVWFDMLFELEGDCYTLVLLGIEPPDPIYDNIPATPPRYWLTLCTSSGGRVNKLRFSHSDVSRWYRSTTHQEMTSLYRVA